MVFLQIIVVFSVFFGFYAWNTPKLRNTITQTSKDVWKKLNSKSSTKSPKLNFSSYKNAFRDAVNKGKAEAKEKSRQKAKAKIDNDDYSSQSVTNFVQLIIDKMNDDFLHAPYLDKFITSYGGSYGYKFEPDYYGKVKTITFLQEFSKYRLEYVNGKNGKKATLSNQDAIDFGLNYKKMLNDSTTRSKSKSSKKTSSSSSSSSSYSTDEIKNQLLYNKLLGIYNSRETQLNTMASTDPQKPSLENELNAVKGKLEKIKPKTGLF